MAFIPSALPVLRSTPSSTTTFRGRALASRALASRALPPRAHAPYTAPTCADKGITFPALDGSPLRIGIVWTRWGDEKVTRMVSDVKAALTDCSVGADNIVEMQVPGAFELPMAARLMCATQKVDAVVAVGVLVNGETNHYEYIAGAVTDGLMDLQLSVNVPIVFGVLTCPNEETAVARSLGDKSNADGWGRTAVEMAMLKDSQTRSGAVKAGVKRVGF